MKQIVKYEVFLSNEKTFVKCQPCHVFEQHFVSVEGEDLRVLEDAKFDFEWKIRSFVQACRDVFTHVYVNKSCVVLDYEF